jgi:hypothetical protein
VTSAERQDRPAGHLPAHRRGRVGHVPRRHAQDRGGALAEVGRLLEGAVGGQQRVAVEATLVKQPRGIRERARTEADQALAVEPGEVRGRVHCRTQYRVRPSRAPYPAAS